MKLPMTIAASLALAAVPADGAPLQEAPPPVEQPLATRTDQAMRMTVPVTIGPHGPYAFVVDTGADRTVISRQVADRLGLPAGDTATMHSMSGVSRIETVQMPTLGIAGREVEDVQAPALDQGNLGAEGLLGLDSLKGRRIIMDFRRKTISILEAGEREAVDPDTIVVTARSRYGQLVLVDADVDGTPVTVIVDSGAQNTIGNSSLRTLLGKRNRRLAFFKTELIDVTGGRLAADVAAVGRIRIGGITLGDVVIAFADAHPFKRFGLEGRPAMLLGMDTLRAFKRVSVDFAQRKVRFLPPEGA